MLTTHRHDRRDRRQAAILLESLDDRLLLAGGAPGATAEGVFHYEPASHAQVYRLISPREDLRQGAPAALPANVSAGLRLLYREYEDQSSTSLVRIRPRVAVVIKVAFPPALGAYVGALRRDGMQIIRAVPADGLVEGTLPIARLPAVAPLAAHVWAAPHLS